MSDAFSSRLRSLLGRDPRSQKEIAACAGIGESALVNYKKGRIPKAEELFRLAKALDVSAGWLLTGEPEGNIPKRELPVSTGARIHDRGIGYGACGGRRIPVLGWAHAGELHDYQEVPAHEVEMVPTDCRDPKAFAVRLEGDSMAPAYHEGDVLVVMPSELVRQGCLAVVRHSDGVIFRRLDLTAETMRTIPLNGIYTVGEYRREEILWAHPVWGSWRQLWK